MRTLGMLVACCVLLVTHAFAADAQRPRGGGGGGRDRSVWGTVTKATAESVTIAPEAAGTASSAAARKNGANGDQAHADQAHGDQAHSDQKVADQDKAPAPQTEQTFALTKDHTEYMFAEIGMQRVTSRGTVFRTLNEPAPATAADVKPGQFVQITPANDNAAAGAGAAPASPPTARRVMIVWSMPGTIVKIDGDTLTFRPAADANAATIVAGAPTPPAPGAAPAPTAVVDGDDDRTFEISKIATQVRIAALTDEHPAPNGRGVVQTIRYNRGTLADLRPDQSVIICVKDDAAVKITILAADRKN